MTVSFADRITIKLQPAVTTVAGAIRSVLEANGGSLSRSGLFEQLSQAGHSAETVRKTLARNKQQFQQKNDTVHLTPDKFRDTSASK
jgi:hypothetical protein